MTSYIEELFKYSKDLKLAIQGTLLGLQAFGYLIILITITVIRIPFIPIIILCKRNK